MIIDIHTHCFPDALASRAVSSLARTSGLTPFSDGTTAGLKTNMLSAGVDISVLQPIATKPDQTISINKWAYELNVEGLVSFGTVHPDFPNWKESLKWLKKMGFKGIKFHPEYQNFFADDPKVFSLYDEIFSLGMIVLFHSGEDLSYNEPFKCTPARLKVLLDNFPGGKIIAGHMGGYRYWDDTEKYLVGRDIYLDTSFSLRELGVDRSVEIFRNHGTSKILFGSDSPWCDQSEEISFIKSLPLSQKEIYDILGNNAKKLLNL